MHVTRASSSLVVKDTPLHSPAPRVGDHIPSRVNALKVEHITEHGFHEQTTGFNRLQGFHNLRCAEYHALVHITKNRGRVANAQEWTSKVI